mgnify:CR=1 FL=1
MINVRELTVSIEGRVIINNLNFSVGSGSIVLVRGPSGSGKSTLLKVLAGLIPKVYKRFRVRGEVSIYGLSPEEFLEKGLVAYIPQELTSFFLGSKVYEEFEVLGIELSEFRGLRNKYLSELSDGQLYKLLALVALGSGIKLLLLDEPSSHVDEHSLINIMNSLRKLCSEEGLTTVLVDHRINLLRDYADLVVELGGHTDTRVSSVRGCLRSGNDDYVIVKDAWFSYGGYEVLKGVNLSVRSGEALGVLGRNGVGKTTLLKILANILKVSKGYVYVKQPTFYIPQRPTYWFATNSVRDEALLYSKLFKSSTDLDYVLKTFGLGHLLYRNPYTLSVGEARRLSMVLAYIALPNVLLFDEPSLGLDNNSLNTLVTLLDYLRNHGKAVVVATHDNSIKEFLDNTLSLEVGS